MNDGNKIGIIDFGIVYFLTDEFSNSLFDMMFLSLKTDNNMKNFYSILNIIIRLICSNQSQHEKIFENLRQDKEFNFILSNIFSSNGGIVKIINRIISLENIEINQNAYKLMLSSVSGLQTIEYANDNKPLTMLTRVYMDKSIHI